MSWGNRARIDDDTKQYTLWLQGTGGRGIDQCTGAANKGDLKSRPILARWQAKYLVTDNFPVENEHSQHH